MHTMTQQEFNQGMDKVWQISQKEPLLVIDEQESCRVVLPFSLYQQLTQFMPTFQRPSNLTNAERIGMTPEQLALVDEDFEFERNKEMAQAVEL